MRDHFRVTIFTTSPHHNTSNSQVERLHHTLSEIARWTKNSLGLNGTIDRILSSSHALFKEVRDKFAKLQAADLQHLNKDRMTMQFSPRDKGLY